MEDVCSCFMRRSMIRSVISRSFDRPAFRSCWVLPSVTGIMVRDLKGEGPSGNDRLTWIKNFLVKDRDVVKAPAEMVRIN